MQYLINILNSIPAPLQKEWVKENGKRAINDFFDYMKRSDFLKPIEEGDTLDFYANYIGLDGRITRGNASSIRPFANTPTQPDDSRTKLY